MSGFLYVLISPVLLLISIQLTIFAAITTTLAFSTLVFRALLVYAELAAALMRDQFANNTLSKDTTIPSKKPAEETYPRRKGRKGSTASGSSNSDSTTPKAPDTNGFRGYSASEATRDFEGVGGWRIPGTEDEDELWTSMNSRLELPAIGNERRRNHYRSRTSGSLNTYRLSMKSHGQSRTRTPSDNIYAARSTSPEEYFTNHMASKSTTALDTANIGNRPLRHKASNSSSGSSQGSNRTLHLTLSNFDRPMDPRWSQHQEEG